MSGPQALPEAARAAAELVQEIVRVFKVRRLYDPGHPQRLDVEETAAERIQALLASHGAVTLDIEEDALRTEGTVVYQQEGTKESLAFLLHREGLRQLVLHPGLEPGELTVFLDRIGAAALAATETDLIAQLWEERFVHIRFAFVERLADEEWTPPSARDAIEEDDDRPPIQLATEDREARTTNILQDFDSTLYFLDDEDMAALQAELEAEKSRALLTECLTLIRELLMNPVRDDPGSLLAVLADIQAHLVEEGQYARVQELHAVFVPYLDSRAADDRSRRAFQELRRMAVGESTLARLAGQLDAGVVTDTAAAAYYRAFGASDVALLLAGAGDLKKLCQRAPLAEAFRDLARGNPNGLRTALSSNNPEAAEAAAYLTGLVGDPRLLDALGIALQSAEPAVRREALLALKQFGGGRALELVARAIHDPDPGVRLYALRHVVSHRYAPALARVAELLDREVPEDERSMTERRLLFEAYGALGGSGVVEELARRLRRRGGLFRKTDPEETACVLVGLGATTAPSARAIIENALDDKQPLVSRTARQVLDTWGSPVAWSV